MPVFSWVLPIYIFEKASSGLYRVLLCCLFLPPETIYIRIVLPFPGVSSRYALKEFMLAAACSQEGNSPAMAVLHTFWAEHEVPSLLAEPGQASSYSPRMKDHRLPAPALAAESCGAGRLRDPGTKAAQPAERAVSA